MDFDVVVPLSSVLERILVDNSHEKCSEHSVAENVNEILIDEDGLKELDREMEEV
jgi:hypothetical protein